MDFSSLLQQSSLGFYKDFSSLLQQSSLGFYKSSHLGSDKDLVCNKDPIKIWSQNINQHRNYQHRNHQHRNHQHRNNQHDSELPIYMR